MNEVSRIAAALGRTIAVRVEEAIRAVLPVSVSLRVVRVDGLTISLALNDRVVTAHWVREGWLRAIHELLDADTPRPDLVVARRLGPASRAALSAAGVGWVDETGAAEVVVGSLILKRDGSLGELKAPRWRRSVLGVAEALLCGTRATVAAVAEATGLSTGACTYALRLLTDRGLLEASSHRGRGSARRVADVDALLAAYVEAAGSLAHPLSLQVGVTWQDAVDGLAKVGRTWSQAGVEWAATGQVAAAVMAPLLTEVRSAMVYVDADTVPRLEAVATRVELRPIEGGRLTLAPFPTTTTRKLATTADGVRVAPWPRVFADLNASGVRGEEAAEHLREVVGG
jgi:hypothetical protein